MEINKKSKIGLKGGKNEAINNLNWTKGKYVLENICGQFPVNGSINNIFGAVIKSSDLCMKHQFKE